MKKNWYKGITATAITLAMAGAAFTVPAMAIDYDLNYGDVYVGEDETGVWSGQTNNPDEGYFYYVKSEDSYYSVEGKYYHKDGGDNTVNISQGTIDTDDFAEGADIPQTGDGSNQVNISGDLSESDIEINISSGESQTPSESDNTVNVTLTDVVTNDTGDGISVSGDVNINVVGENQLNAGDGGAGLDIDAGSKVTITGVDQEVTDTDENQTTEIGQISSNGTAIKVETTASSDKTTINVNNINADADDTFLTVGNNTNADITIENSKIESGDNAVQVGTFDNISVSEKVDTNSTVDLTLDDTTITVDLKKNEDFSAAGIYIQDGSHVDLELSGVNTIKTENLAQKQQDALGHNVPANMYCGLNVEGIRVGGAVSDWRGDSSDSAASLTIKGEDNAQLNIDGFGTGMVISANASTTVQDGVTVNIDDSTATSSTQSGRGMIVAGSLEVTGEDTTLNVTGTTKGDYLIYNDTASGHRDANSGWGIVSSGSGITVSDHASLNVSDTDSGGIYFQKGNFDVHDHANVTVHDTVGNGIWFEGNSHEFNISEYSNIYVHDANHGIQASISNAVSMNVSDHSNVIAKNNHGSGILNINTVVKGNSHIEASKNDYHGFSNGAFEIYDSKADFNDNGWIGLNIAAVLPGSDSAVIDHSIVNANNNGQSVDFVQGYYTSGAGIRLYTIPMVINSSTVISKGSDVGICFYNTVNGPGVLTVKGSSVLAIDGTNYDFYDDWNSAKGHTGRDFINSGSLQADLGAMYGYYLSTDESLKGLSGLDLFLAITKLYNNGKGINAIVTGKPGDYVSGVVNNSQYTGPVNSEGTLLFQFALNGDIEKGAALTNNGDGTYTFTYVDPNTGNKVTYTFRYNTGSEDLTDTVGNNAYVWTPVTIIHYNPLNNKLSESTNTTAHINSDDNTATDVTIFGTTINLAEKDMPSYQAEENTTVTTTVNENGDTVTTTTKTTSTFGWWVCIENGKIVDLSEEVPDEDASQEEWDAFYKRLNTQVTEETNLLELCGGIAELAEQITVYGMWTSETEQTVVTTPAEPEIPDYPEIPEYPELPDYDPPEVDIDDPDVPLVEEPEEPEEPEQPTEEIDDEETPLTPSIPDEVVDEIIAEIEDEVTPLTSVPKTGAEMPAATAALPAGVLALAVAALVRRTKRKN